MKLLIVDNDEGLIHFLDRLFVEHGYEVASCADGSTALARLAEETFDAILLDYRMPGLDGLETLDEIKRVRIKTPVILMTAHGTTETAIEAMKRGAYDYLLKPFDTEQLLAVVADAVKVHQLMRGIVGIGPSVGRVKVTTAKQTRIVGSHARMQEVFKLIGQVAAKDVTVLITGDSGTGKELVARAIHEHGHRRDHPFMAVNCAAIPDALFESELFGYEPGAFTGADRTHAGRIERCDRGTLFFDEIGDMSPSTQAKVLRVLQEGEFERLGGSDTLQVDIRILAATNKTLEDEVIRNRFREDLYYRLKTVPIHLPALRERLDDIPALVNHFVARFAKTDSKPVAYISDAAITKLRTHPWPGNVRELEHCLRHAVLVCRGDTLLPEHVAFESGPAVTSESLVDSLVHELLRTAGPAAHASVIDRVEQALITHALQHCNNNQVHAAKLLGISRNTLRSRMKKYE